MRGRSLFRDHGYQLHVACISSATPNTILHTLQSGVVAFEPLTALRSPLNSYDRSASATYWFCSPTLLWCHTAHPWSSHVPSGGCLGNAHRDESPSMLFPVDAFLSPSFPGSVCLVWLDPGLAETLEVTLCYETFNVALPHVELAVLRQGYRTVLKGQLRLISHQGGVGRQLTRIPSVSRRRP